MLKICSTRRRRRMIVENKTNKQIRNHNRNLADAAMYTFLSKVKYKCNWYGTTIHELGQFEASTIECHVCSHRIKKLPTYIRNWTCPNCGTVHDRDENASEVVKKKTMIALGLI